MTGGFNVDKTGKTHKTGMAKHAEQNKELIKKREAIEKNSIFDQNVKKELLWEATKLVSAEKDLEAFPILTYKTGPGQLFDPGYGKTGFSKIADRKEFLSTLKDNLTEDYTVISEKKASVNVEIKKIKPDYTE